MIFASVNEKGEPAWKLVLEGRKTVTRRSKPKAVGKVFGDQPGRGKKAVCRAKVISCIKHIAWLKKEEDTSIFVFGRAQEPLRASYLKSRLEDEAHREGFESWQGLLDWFDKHKIDINNTWRIQIRRV